MKTRLAIRGFLGKELQFCEWLETDDEARALARSGEKHSQMMEAGSIDMVEIEFLDELDINQRFLRFGLNPEGMVNPLALDLSKPKP